MIRNHRGHTAQTALLPHRSATKRKLHHPGSRCKACCAKAQPGGPKWTMFRMHKILWDVDVKARTWAAASRARLRQTNVCNAKCGLHRPGGSLFLDRVRLRYLYVGGGGGHGSGQVRLHLVHKRGNRAWVTPRAAHRGRESGAKCEARTPQLRSAPAPAPLHDSSDSDTDCRQLR